MYKFLCVHILLSSLGTIPSSGTAGSYGDFMFTSLRKCQTVSQTDASLLPNQSYIRSQLFPFLANPCYLIFFNSSHPSRLKLYLTGVLICISLMTSGVEYLFMNALATFCIFFGKIYSDLFPIFLSWVIFFLLIESYILYKF